MSAAIGFLLLFTIIGDARKAATSGDFTGAEKLVREHQKAQGATPDSIEAYSWLARGALNAKKYDEALKYAAETEKQVLAKVNASTLDGERHLPIALGAAIEVRGQALGATEGRASGVDYLRSEMAKYRKTSIRTRIQKNLNLLSLEGKPAPKVDGMKLPAKPVLLFFWAHWCPDCKAEAPVLAQIQKTYPQVAVIGPTKLYGYVEGGKDAAAPEERKYVQVARDKFYSEVKDMPVLIHAETFANYGASTTPTLVLIDRKGIVQLYHPGRMTFDELKPYLDKFAGA
ncbi:MAG: TlpA family protein disulfide reductase [Bryobacteraceae bacterium]|nr:TlpA family protein disulfide reductase [Bryobacteraceae bacterium]